MRKKPLIIFDMDGVLIDVSRSYREVTRRTVIEYLRQVLVAHVPDDFITLADVDAVKKSGGLNNDWDLTDAILNAYLRGGCNHIDEDLLRQLSKIRTAEDDHTVFDQMRIIDFSKHRPRLEDLVQKKAAPALFSSTSWSAGDRSPLLLNQGDVGSGNLTKRIFQELYLGRKLFQQNYGEETIFHDGDGYIERERSIPTKAQLEQLYESHALSIATGRPGAEASYALAQFDIGGYFKSIVSEDDVVEAEEGCSESLRKPHPFILSLSMEKCGYSPGDSVYYVGDMPDDIIAARAAKIRPIGFVNRDAGDNEDQRHEHVVLLEYHGASAVFTSFDEIISFLIVQ